MTDKKVYNDGLCLEHEIEISLPVKCFDRAFLSFKKSHRRAIYKSNWMSYSTHSDGKFFFEAKENPTEDKDYIIRLSGWVDKDILEIRRIYVNEEGVKLYDWVYDLLDLFEELAVSNKGCFYFKYVDFDSLILDTYKIVHGLEKDMKNSDVELAELLFKYGYSKSI